jgi:hypothetical protein
MLFESEQSMNLGSKKMRRFHIHRKIIFSRLHLKRILKVFDAYCMDTPPYETRCISPRYAMVWCKLETSLFVFVKRDVRREQTSTQS